MGNGERDRIYSMDDYSKQDHGKWRDTDGHWYYHTKTNIPKTTFKEIFYAYTDYKNSRIFN